MWVRTEINLGKRGTTLYQARLYPVLLGSVIYDTPEPRAWLLLPLLLGSLVRCRPALRSDR